MALTSVLTIAGNLVSEPDLKYSADGKPYARITVAVNAREFDRATKEWKDGEAVFWNVTTFGDLAEHVGHSLTKGMRVIVHGVVKSDSWTDKDSGTKRTDKKMIAEDIGASLMFANVSATKAAPSSGGQQNSGPDGWATPGAIGDDTPF